MKENHKEPEGLHTDSGAVIRTVTTLGVLLCAAGVWLGMEKGIAWAWWVAWIAGGLAVALTLISALVSRRTTRRDRLSQFVEASYAGMKLESASSYKKGVPQKVVLNVPGTLPDHDSLWRSEVEKKFAARMGAKKVRAKWDTKKGRVTLAAVDASKPTDRDRQEDALQRIERVFRPLFRGTELSVNVPEWQPIVTDERPAPNRIVLKYGVILNDGSEMWQRKIEVTAGLKLGGRWRGKFDPINDRAELEPRPELPEMVRHPGGSIYENVDINNNPRPILYYGINEDSKPIGWRIGQKTNMPHSLCVGATGGGKTNFLRNVIYGAVAQGITVFGCDPKEFELSPFIGFPGVYIASDPEDMAAMLDDMLQLMYDRNNQIKQDPTSVANMRPVLFILDELLILRMRLKKLWKTPYVDEDGKTKKRTGNPEWLDNITMLLALARSAMINVVIGVQRPDATLFEDGARDNLQHRVAMMRLSPQGAQMVWDSTYVGVDLPLLQGRAMASPDGKTPIEAQTYWVDDPYSATGEDLEVVESIRALGEKHFADYIPPIDVSRYEQFTPPARTKNDTAQMPQPVSDFEDSETVEGQQTATATHKDSVLVETLVEGDTILLDDERLVEVVNIEQDYASDDDSLIVTISENGAEEDISFSETERVVRVLEMALAG